MPTIKSHLKESRNKISQSIGMSLYNTRTQFGMTLSQVSEISGLSISSISNIESGVYCPSMFTLITLASALGLHASEIIKDIQDINGNIKK